MAFPTVVVTPGTGTTINTLPNAGQATAAESLPVVLASNQTLPLPSGAATEAKQDTGNASLATIATGTPALGQALAAASVPVVLTAAQVSTLTPPAAITGFATAVKQPRIGEAGIASADVITVQGIASGTALGVSVAASTAIIGATREVFGVIADSAGTTLTVKRARATVTTATATQIVAAVSSKQIQVLGYSIQSQGSNTPVFNFQDDAGSPVVLSRTWKLDATGAAGVNGVQVTPTQFGCGVDPTTVTQKLMGKMDTTGSVVVEVTYVEI